MKDGFKSGPETNSWNYFSRQLELLQEDMNLWQKTNITGLDGWVKSLEKIPKLLDIFLSPSQNSTILTSRYFKVNDAKAATKVNKIRRKKKNWSLIQ